MARMTKAEKDEIKAEEEGGGTHTDGEPNGDGGGDEGEGGGSIAERAEEKELPIPESKPLGEKGGQIPLPGTPAQKRKPVEIVVELGSSHTPGAGQLDVDGEHLLIVRAEYKEGVPRAKRDSDREIIGWKYIQKLRPTWVESLDAFLAANGMKIVRVDDEGEALSAEALTNIEQIRRDREGVGALD